MNKPQIINNYMQAIYKKVDDLKVTYPKATAKEIVEMEKGFRYCAQKSAEWLEEFMDFVNASQLEELALKASGPLPQVIDKNIETTNKIAATPELKKKKPLSFLFEGAKDMGNDFWNAAQGANKKP